MLRMLIDRVSGDWERVRDLVDRVQVQPKTTLLHEGQVADKIYFVEHGALRMWFNKDGRDVTFQFFFEGRAVASIESFLNGTPSLFSIESIEHSEMWVITKTNFEEIMRLYPSLRDELFALLVERFQNYTHLFLSRIKDTPQQRYEDLLKNYPQIIHRVAQHYIASYLGITAVSLSRIRNRKL